MITRTRAYTLFVTGALAIPASAAAHGFGRLYNLPVPLWLYAWASAAALVLSFLIAGMFITARTVGSGSTGRDLADTGWARGLHRARPLLQGASLFVLLLCIATGFLGNRDPMRNFSMVFFWITFTLGMTYATVVLGDFFSALNPWRVLCQLIGRAFGRYTQGRFAYPAALGDWPAVVFYLGFIWFELFGTGRPAPLGMFLAAYTVLNVAGVGLVGAKAWFRHCEFFGMFLRLVARMAPIDYEADPDGGRGRLRLRWPFAGLVHSRPEGMAGVVFALAMLSTTAFDGLKATQWWVALFWQDPTGIVTRLAGTDPVHAIAVVRPWYIAWETAWLFASPFVYLAAFLLAVWLGKLMARSTRTMRDLALDFGHTLLPIALVYHVTHYATLLLTDGMKVLSLLSDPFGWSWNLFGTAFMFRAPILPEMGVVWHTQVGLILFGHIASVCVAHRVALRVFPRRRDALLSQLPMLLMMVGLTVAGLWILSQPLTAMLMR